MKRIMAIDFGKKRVGVAITDPLCTISQPLLTIRPKSVNDLIQRLKCIAVENDVGLIIVGNPISMKGEPTAMSREIERFTRRLKRHFDIRIELWDERYLSRYAVNKLKSTGLSVKKDVIDRVAASIMLDEYLQAKRA
ncbi:MAG: Holliday junction resolvase RuvX [candidate division WOR-3 bacterium]|nr:MAG: Holliday junction resolvase RuvX [candidate division WOR-3 bacterium]